MTENTTQQAKTYEQKVERLLRKAESSGLTRMGTRDNMAFVQILSTQILFDTFIRDGSRGQATAGQEPLDCKTRIRLG